MIDPSDPMVRPAVGHGGFAGLSRHVAAALRQGRARLAFQPVVDVHTARPIFFEGLIRLADPRGQIVPAAEFMPELAESALGRDLDTLGLRLGLSRLGKHADRRIAVNMSARSLADPGWRRSLDLWLDRHPDAAPRLVLELSERSVMTDIDRTIRFMEDMQAHGVCLALDDFGSGVEVCRRLAALPFDIVKLDRGFAPAIDGNADARAVAATLLDIAGRADWLTVALGVERAEEAAVFRDLGADALQGYHIGRPGPLS